MQKIKEKENSDKSDQKNDENESKLNEGGDDASKSDKLSSTISQENRDNSRTAGLVRRRK